MIRLASALLLSATCLLFGCDPVAHPGESVGVFQVNGSLDANGCGAAVPAIDPIAFTVELRDDLGRALWIMDDQPVQDGIRMPDGGYRFRSGTTIPVIAPEPGFAGCSLQQVELVEVHVTEIVGEEGVDDADPDAGVTASTLEIDGISEIQFTPTIDSDCSPLPVVNGGPWAELPCTLDYTLFGTGVGSAPVGDGTEL